MIAVSSSCSSSNSPHVYSGDSEGRQLIYKDNDGHDTPKSKS